MTFGIIAVVVGIASIALAVAFNEVKPEEKGSITSIVFGEKKPNSSQGNLPLVLKTSYMATALIGLGFAIFAYLRKENDRGYLSGGVLSLAGLLWQYILIVLAIAIVIGVVMVIMSNAS